ncbi:hypothetical protein CEXT_353701 [Caerostris extrusa]|uniref:Uncharacterized protein n=1 Tax=Caerostris extrusa TaxID=172846 RepID=A0AAV4QWC4_CAEEX|nr:hypothetical protein CEXT_353701 [Caerostris extrusa]
MASRGIGHGLCTMPRQKHLSDPIGDKSHVKNQCVHQLMGERFSAIIQNKYCPSLREPRTVDANFICSSSDSATC